MPLGAETANFRLDLRRRLPSIAGSASSFGFGCYTSSDDQALARRRKNVIGRAGQPWPVDLCVPLVVLYLVKPYHSHQMEEYLSESVVERRFCGLSNQTSLQVRLAEWDALFNFTLKAVPVNCEFTE